ncbi:MAG: cation-transporting P-type ATPase, partial [Bacteroidia bacterium]|nr:cation-transporting P-type ATPase [Bacteroidia bacterium]
YNILETFKQRSLFNIFLSQFTSPLVWVLAAATILAFLFQEWLEGMAVLVVIFINSMIGFYMEVQARNSMESLRKLSRTMTRVLREGQLKELEAGQLVPGDIIFMEAGDVVPADCRLIEENNLAVNEAALTGESTPISKRTDVLKEDTVLANLKNLVFKGTIVTRGNTTAIVYATGKNTQLGKIASLTEGASKESTPLEKKLNVLSQKLIILTLILAVFIMLIGLFQDRSMYLMIETAIALAIAAIPEGLPIVATIALARVMLRLAKHKVIVKQLNAVETLGETQVIFTDKTGTLTENQLLPCALVFDFDEAEISLVSDKLVFEEAAGAGIENSYAFEQLIKIAALCNNASLDVKKDNTPTGDPLEVALLQLVNASGHNILDLQANFERVGEIPFDSNTRMMGTMNRNGNRPDYMVSIKGALEVVLRECDYVLTRDGKIPLEDRDSWLRRADDLAARGMRVLAFAYSEIDRPRENFFEHLILVGCIAFIDPPRREVKDAIATCHKAGIDVIMVTGDHPETARYIAGKIGIGENESESVMHGRRLDEVFNDEINDYNQIRLVKVFARVSPEQKLKLVDLYQGLGRTVGMTGDGINDTPALKKADIGIAMGQRGTASAREVADLVLKDDAFTSIVVAIKQGRSIFENIRHFVVYLLSCNLSELLLVAAAFFSNLTLPLLPLQILFINMVTDVFPAFALAMNQDSDKVMEQAPRSKKIPIISLPVWKAISVYAFAITIGSLGALIFATFYLELGDKLANNFAFYTLIMAQLWNVFNLPEANKSFFINEVTRNKYIWLSLIVCTGIMVIAYLSPLLREVLNLASFKLDYIIYVLLFSLIPLLIIQLLKRTGLVR